MNVKIVNIYHITNQNDALLKKSIAEWRTML